MSYPADLIDHVPEEALVRSYGCGSPVTEATPSEGDTVVDLGCGTGVECFIAARLVGSSGRVIGVDMLEPMLRRARAAALHVSQRLGYENLEFRQGFLEALPLEDGTAHVIVSNCVLNLSVDKRRTFSEIYRVLRENGRAVISDVVCEEDPPAEIRHDPKLKGECIAGALTQRDLFGLLRETGFTGLRIVRRFPYRTIQGHPFFSLTFEGRRTCQETPVRVLYRGPQDAVVTPSGITVFTGLPRDVPSRDLAPKDLNFFTLGDRGEVLNVDLGLPACCLPPAPPTDPTHDPETATSSSKAERDPSATGREALPIGLSTGQGESGGCLGCGREIVYFQPPKRLACTFCGRVFDTDAACSAGHFVCDACHSTDAVRITEHVCGLSRETDLIRLFVQIARHPTFHMHGPEHHALVPAVILATYGNLGGRLPSGALKMALERSRHVVGGFCGFFGVCGAAVGVGLAFAVILESSPLKAAARQQAQKATEAALSAIAAFKAARCCQRDCWLALRSAAKSSVELLPVKLEAREELMCDRSKANRECFGDGCPLFRS